MIGVHKSNEELKESLGWKKDEQNFYSNGKECNDVWDFVYERVQDLGLFSCSEEEYIGYLVADGDDGDFHGDTLSITDVMDKAKYVSNVLKVPIEEVKLYSGVRSC